MEPLNSLQAAQTFGNALAESLSDSFTHRLASQWQFRLIDELEPMPRSEKTVGFRITAEGELQGECCVFADQQQVERLATKLLGEPKTEFEASHKDAVTQLLSSAMEALSTALLDQYGPVTFAVEQRAEMRKEQTAVSLTATSDDGEQISFSLYLNKALLDAMVSPYAAKGLLGAKRPGTDPANLQLVMDVELSVSLRFGQCQLPLREVLDLASGSVIELDRDVDDPVELLLDGKVIARGEAVIVDGNYGLRITEIPEPLASHFGG
ncbi:MAG: flagellar motor switch protein FliN [Acidobacteriaceae bacterium]